MNNYLDKTPVSKGTETRIQLANEVEKGVVEVGQKFTDYGKQCVVNAIANLLSVCKNNSYEFKDLDLAMVKIALTNIGFTELNFAATPAEAYWDIRKADNGYAVVAKPQGAGNEKLTRRFGVNVKELYSPILVREKDKYTLPGFDGTKMTPFTWQPASYDGKVIMVVYPLKKMDDTMEYLIATREGIKPNLIAQIRQNNLYTFKKKNSQGNDVLDVEKREAFYKEVNDTFENMTVDEILNTPRWLEELTPTYSSGGSKEAMVIRKMKNNALKNYPRDFGNSAIAQAVNDMREDRDDSLFQKEDALEADIVEKVEEEINEQPKASEGAVKDFDVPKEEPKKEEKKKEEKPKPEPEPQPAPTSSKDYGF